MTTVYYTRFPVHVALTRPDVVRRGQRWHLNDPRFRHRAVMGLFDAIDAEHPRASGNILFRLDRVPGIPPYFLVQSTIAPTNSQHLYGVEVKQVELGQPLPGQPVRFRLAVNAVRRLGEKKKQEMDKSTMPVSLVDDLDNGADGFPAWLQKKLSPGLKNVEVLNHIREVLSPNGNPVEGKKDFSVQVDLVDGVAVVDDAIALYAMMLTGVGRAKSFGCGLLSLQRLG